MAAPPIYLDVEEEIPELIERLRQSSASEIPVIVPARSRIGQSRFNFRLLSDFARQFGKRISIISNDSAVQQMASENGLTAFNAIEDYGSPEAEPALALAGVGAGAAPPFTPSPRLQAAPPVATQPTRTPKVSMAPPLRSLVPASGRSRIVLYAGTAVIVFVAMLAAAIVVPSATIDLTAQAQSVSDTATITAAPSSAPVKVHAVTTSKSLSQQFHSTGVKDTPAVASAGTVVFQVSCPQTQIQIKPGQIVSTQTGTQFTVQGLVQVSAGSAAAASVLASLPGAAGNVGAGTITYINDPQHNPAVTACLTVNNPNATAAGADEVKTTFVSQGDLDSAKAQLEGTLRGQVLDDLGKQAGSAERLADTVDYKSAFSADKKANDPVAVFQGSDTLTGDGAVYNVDDVKAALKADLAGHVPAGFTLTDNPVQSDFHIAQSTADGHISFTGTAKGFMAPKLDFDKIRSHLLGSTTAGARLYLGTLPVRTATVTEKPVSLPLLPFLNSKIKINYKVDTSPTAPTP